MKIKQIVLFLIFGFTFGQQTIAVERKEWSIISHKGESMFAASQHIEATRKGFELELSSKARFDSAQNLLSHYYWLLKEQKIKQVARLYTNKDGSRAKFENAITTNKLNLTKYSTLNRVQITSIQQWDSFTVYGVKLFNAKNKSMSWQERVVCEIRCYMVFAIADNSQASDLLNLSKMTYLESKRLNGDLTDKLKFKSKPIEFSVSHPEGGLYQGKKKEFNFKFAMQRFKGTQTVSRKKDCSIYESLETIAFCQFLNESNQVDSENRAAIEEFVKSITAKPQGNGVMMNENRGGMVQSIIFSSNAFLARVNKWQSVKLLGYVDSDSTRFVIFRPFISDNSVQPIQAVSFAIGETKKSNRLIYGSNWEDGYLFFYNNIVANKLNSALL
ncbi:hypothetical protein RJ41_04270 [Alteromonas marina]|uniref:Uncharacterized protein n=1 Tax=Alteromonas marina TaxID=203795 RepID=A0A0B3YEN6_9ALTE|nr:hypothetical protein [Alteromonas marina]KHT55567.1 hypothetical protein RJ41_04270 [Alteromonas marina]